MMKRGSMTSVAGVIFLLSAAIGTAEAASQPKSITIDGIDYVPKASQKAAASTADTHEAKPRKPETGTSHTSKNLDNFQMKGEYGAGVEVSVVNLGIGPSAEYWVTDNVVASGHLGLGTFTTYGVRGDYLFDKEIKLYNQYKTRPYAGVGYTFIKGPEESFAGSSVKTDGSGFDVHAGLFMPAQKIYKNVALRAEVAYSTAKVEATAKSGGFQSTVSADYSSFGFGFGVYYFFQ